MRKTATVEVTIRRKITIVLLATTGDTAQTETADID